MDSSLLPLYLVVANELEARITADQYPPGTLLPAERKLAIGFDVSQITIRAAMRILSDKGLIVRRRGIGTTVVEAHPRFVWQLGWLDALITTIIPSSLSIQSMQTARPPRWVAERFGSAAKVHRMTTLRQRGGQEARPFMTSELFHPLSIGLKMRRSDFERKPTTNSPFVITVLERKCRITVTNVRQTMTAELADKASARLFGVRHGDPVLVVTRDYFDAQARLVQTGRSRYRTGDVDYVLNLSRSRNARIGSDSHAEPVVSVRKHLTGEQ